MKPEFCLGVELKRRNRMADNRCVRIYDLKQKVKYHPEIGTYVSEEDIDLMERVFVDGGKAEIIMAKSMEEVLEDIQKQEFVERYCRACGSQRCEGIDTDWFEGCEYKDLFKGEC